VTGVQTCALPISVEGRVVQRGYRSGTAGTWRRLGPWIAGVSDGTLELAVGGGAVLDAVGFAAAITHRGLRLIRIATTTLSQADSAMAVKNGINAFGKKNYMGVFATPWAIINDESTLDTLSEDHWLAGFSEAIKVSLLKDPLLFEYIDRNRHGVRRRDLDVSIPIIRRSGTLHFDHITQNGDPFEREDARPLDFGHWSAHKLEQMSGFELSHGQAVAIGIAIDATYANFMGWLDDADHRRILECLSGIGFKLYHKVMQQARSEEHTSELQSRQ